MENKVTQIIKKLKEKKVQYIDEIMYELDGHQIPNAIEKNNFFYKFLQKKLKINYYFEEPGNFCQNEWVVMEFNIY